VSTWGAGWVRGWGEDGYRVRVLRPARAGSRSFSFLVRTATSAARTATSAARTTPVARIAPSGARARTVASTARAGTGVVAGMAALALVVAGCTVTAKHQSSAGSSPAVTAGPERTDAPAGLERFYSQQLEWETCDEGECATAVVPIDYADPGAGTTSIALARKRASGERIGSLLLNPGGPGGSGFDFLSSATGTVSKDVQNRYDLVGFDPRGVQHSEPAIRCYDGPEMDELTAYDADYSTPEGVQAAIDRYADFSRTCLEKTGPLFGHVDTVSAARDMDVLRAVLGDEKLHYLGYSYGTQLGATYAALFPQNVGRLVLDGAIDPTLTPEESALEQAVGFESALRAYVTDCQGGAQCPLQGSVDDGMKQVRRFLDRVRSAPLPTGDDDRPLTQALAFTGIAVTLYSESYWSYLTSALRTAFAGDGSILLALSDAYYDRSEDGTYSANQTEAFWSIGCLDGRSSSDPEDMKAEAAKIVAAAPTVGSLFTYGGVLCAQWPVPEVGGLDDYSAAGAAPILVIGTTNDPATPYEQAQALAKILDSGVLLTYEGEGHTAYGRSNDCVKDNVDAYLIDGKVPAEGTRC